MVSLPVSHGSDHASIQVYEARPSGPPRGLVVIVQEIFGVTEHIRSVTDRYAALGFSAWAPAFFDVVEKDSVLLYGQEGLQKGLQLVGQLGWDWPLEILRACASKWSADSTKPMAGQTGILK